MIEPEPAAGAGHFFQKAPAAAGSVKRNMT